MTTRMMNNNKIAVPKLIGYKNYSTKNTFFNKSGNSRFPNSKINNIGKRKLRQSLTVAQPINLAGHSTCGSLRLRKDWDKRLTRLIRLRKSRFFNKNPFPTRAEFITKTRPTRRRKLPRSLSWPRRSLLRANKQLVRPKMHLFIDIGSHRAYFLFVSSTSFVLNMGLLYPVYRVKSRLFNNYFKYGFKNLFYKTKRYSCYNRYSMHKIRYVMRKVRRSRWKKLYVARLREAKGLKPFRK